jgi:hypothetical protein
VHRVRHRAPQLLNVVTPNAKSRESHTFVGTRELRGRWQADIGKTTLLIESTQPQPRRASTSCTTSR